MDFTHHWSGVLQQTHSSEPGSAPDPRGWTIQSVGAGN